MIGIDTSASFGSGDRRRRRVTRVRRPARRRSSRCRCCGIASASVPRSDLASVVAGAFRANRARSTLADCRTDATSRSIAPAPGRVRRRDAADGSPSAASLRGTSSHDQSHEQPDAARQRRAASRGKPRARSNWQPRRHLPTPAFVIGAKVAKARGKASANGCNKDAR